METISGNASAKRGPTQRLADAVITQAFRDLNSLNNAEEESSQRTWETAKAFLLGETPEGRDARSTFCDTLEMDPTYVERMARAVIGVHERPARRRTKSSRNKEKSAGNRNVA